MTKKPDFIRSSRHDRQTLSGSPHNVIEPRTGGKGAGRGPRGSG